MESVGTICEGEWNNSFNASCSEEADFMAQLLGNCSFPNEVQIGPNIALSSSFWGPNENSMYSSDDSSFSFPLGGTNLVGYYPVNNSMTTDYFMMDGKNNGSRVANDDIVEGDDYLRQDIANGLYVESPEEDDLPGKTLHLGIEKRPSEMSKKRHRLPLDVQRKGKLKKCAKIDHDDDMSKPTTKMVPRRPSSSVCSEEDDSIASHEVNGLTSSSSSKGSGALNLSGKTRANRGSATDPQSLYARKRRERINERLRILQNLVPNGTKVDLSTMLEEAVQYVKFLQLQIKLLSSDELWMYAPIAYNGMDIGLDINIPTPNSQS